MEVQIDKLLEFLADLWLPILVMAFAIKGLLLSHPDSIILMPLISVMIIMAAKKQPQVIHRRAMTIIGIIFGIFAIVIY